MGPIDFVGAQLESRSTKFIATDCNVYNAYEFLIRTRDCYRTRKQSEVNRPSGGRPSLPGTEFHSPFLTDSLIAPVGQFPAGIRRGRACT